MHQETFLHRMVFLALFAPRISQSFQSTTRIRYHVALSRFLRGSCNKEFRLFRSSPGNTVSTYPSIQSSALSSLSCTALRQSPKSDNPTTEWKGSSHSTSEFVTHVLITAEGAPEQSPTIGSEVAKVVLEKRNQRFDNHHPDHSPLTAMELLDLGSVWFLPASAPKDPSLGTKPMRLSRRDYDQTMQEGDYLRVHHHPRRFKTVYDYDWSKRIGDQSTIGSGVSSKPGVIVEEDATKGWLVIDKPPRVPVHMTVDNARENAQACLVDARHTEDDEDDVYVTTPQRLDQNTSGLLVVATSPQFAAYFAELLRNKTASQLQDTKHDGTSIDEKNEVIVGNVHKLYKCLVCIQPPLQPTTTSASDSSLPSTWSIGGAWRDLQGLAENSTIVRHYLEPSIRAPKHFVPEPPVEAPDKDAWLESLLRIKHVGPLLTLVGNEPSEYLARALWDPENGDKVESLSSTGMPPRMPSHCQAVTEIQVELLTGRTHQIRGQLKAMGFPLVGDIQYGGAQVFAEGELYKSFSYERLALQCCALDFVDPDVVYGEEGDTTKLEPSERWNRFQLDRAWWTTLLDNYDHASESIDKAAATTDVASDIGLVGSTTIGAEKTYASSSANAQKRPRPDLLPDRVQLSPGKNKYVLVRATHRLEPQVAHWFVKSATPAECGGPYHGNVAQDLREWIEAAGYDVVVTGGGRIDYAPASSSSEDDSHCIVYGFSYGFGKANHELAARIIRDETDGTIKATHDDTGGLY